MSSKKYYAKRRNEKMKEILTDVMWDLKDYLKSLRGPLFVTVALILAIVFSLGYIAEANRNPHEPVDLTMAGVPTMTIELIDADKATPAPTAIPTPIPTEKPTTVAEPIVFASAQAEEAEAVEVDETAGMITFPDLTNDSVDPFTAELYDVASDEEAFEYEDFDESSSSDPFAAALGLATEPEESFFVDMIDLTDNSTRTNTVRVIGLPVYKDWAKSEIILIQEALNAWSASRGSSARIAVDGVFGTKTAQAVKFFQRKNGLTADGVVGPKTQEALGLYNMQQKYYYYNVDLSALSAPSTNLMVYVSLANRKVTVYRYSFSGWEKVGTTSCTIGKESTATPAGIYRTSGVKKDHLEKYPEARLCTHITDGYYFHTTLSRHESTGKAKSHGCIRLPEKYAQWLYENAGKGTVVVIDDRPSYDD